MTSYAVDTSVAVPLLIKTHACHPEVMRWRAGRDLVLAGHASAETYGVLTRLDAPLRLAPDDAVAAIERSFGIEAPGLSTRRWRGLPAALAKAGVAGGAVFDALVALAAHDAHRVLATRDARATSTYRKLGVRYEIVS